MFIVHRNMIIDINRRFQTVVLSVSEARHYECVRYTINNAISQYTVSRQGRGHTRNINLARIAHVQITATC